jgi:hypothetical protein
MAEIKDVTKDYFTEVSISQNFPITRDALRKWRQLEPVGTVGPPFFKTASGQIRYPIMTFYPKKSLGNAYPSGA